MECYLTRQSDSVIFMGPKRVSKKKRRKESIKQVGALLFFCLLAAVLIFFIFYFNATESPSSKNVEEYGQLSSLHALDNVTRINETEEAVITTFQSTAVIGQPVKWKKQIVPKEEGTLRVEIPKQAENIDINKVTDSAEVEAEASIITGGVIKSDSKIPISYLKSTVQKILMGITGRTIDEQFIEIDMKIDERDAEYSIEYETPAPEATEIKLSDREKQIIVSAPDNLGYENILAYTELPKEATANNVKLYHQIDGIKRRVDAKMYDKNNNGLIDYIEWNVPHLSNQSYLLIIEVSKAEHLDENKEFISDIYNEVIKEDGLWSEAVGNNEYVRVTFEQALTNENDITMYARPVSGDARIEVYVSGTETKIAEFENISQENTYKVYLTGIPEGESYETFDLKVIGEIEFDYIVDPTSSCTNSPGATACNSFDSNQAGCGATVNNPQYGCYWEACNGSVKPCSDFIYDPTGCGATTNVKQFGCWWLGCDGTVNACSYYDSSESGCGEQDGCYWEGCYGTATECSSYSTISNCQGQGGCSWVQCDGTATPCTDLSGSSNYVRCLAEECSNTGVPPYICSGARDCNTYDTLGETQCEGTIGCTWYPCKGTAYTCEGDLHYDEEGCKDQSGCYWDGCIGTATPCIRYSSGTCSSQGGCIWRGCNGTATTCNGLDSSQTQCNDQSGCSWSACEGTPTACTSLVGETSCDYQVGCLYNFNEECSGTDIRANTVGGNLCGSTLELGTEVTISYNASCQPDPLSTYLKTNLKLFDITTIEENIGCHTGTSTGDCVKTSTYTVKVNESVGTYTYEAQCYASQFESCAYAADSSKTCSITWVDTVDPTISISYPVNPTIYNTEVTHIDYAAYDLDLDSCWYSLNGGKTNVSDPGCDGVTGVSGTCCDDTLTWTVWINDSAGHVASDSVIFYSTYVTQGGDVTRASQTYTLQNNITGEGDGYLTIKANDITVDLNGYAGSCSANGLIGIAVRDGYVDEGGISLSNVNSSSLSNLIGTHGNFVDISGDNNSISGLTTPESFTTGSGHSVYVTGDSNTISDLNLFGDQASLQVSGDYNDISSSYMNIMLEIIGNFNTANGITIDNGQPCMWITGSNNFIKNSSCINSYSTNVISDSTSNIFLSCDFNTESGSLTREWYYGAHVTYSNGSAADANVKGWNVDNTLTHNLQTDASGNTTCTDANAIIWYVLNSGVRDYASPYQMNATHSPYKDAHSYTPTADQCADPFVFNTDITPPVITFNYFTGDGVAPYHLSNNYGEFWLNTSEPATCRYTNLSDLSYDGMDSYYVSCTSSGGGLIHDCDLDDAPITYLYDGWHTFYIACVDSYGNSNSEVNNIEVTVWIDMTKPTITLDSIGGDTSDPYVTVDSSPDFMLTTNEEATCWFGVDVGKLASGGTSCSADGSGTTHTCSSGDLSEGVHGVAFWCNDTALPTGNINCLNGHVAGCNAPLSSNISFTIDGTPPTITITSIGGDTTVPYVTGDTTPSAVLSTNESATCRWSDIDKGYDTMPAGSCSGAGTTYTCDLGGGWTPNTPQTVYFACVDSYGNNHTSANNKEASFTLDNSAPTITVVAVGADKGSPYSVSDGSSSLTRNVTTSEQATCKWHTSDVGYDLMSYSCTADGTGTGHACGGVGRSDGSYTDYIRCNDTVGNANPTSTTVSYEIDSAAPTQSGHNPASGSTIYTFSPTITFDTDENARCRWSLTDDAYSSMSSTCDSSFTTSHSCSVSGLTGDIDYVYTACTDDTDYYANANTAATNTHLGYYIIQLNISLSKGWNMFSVISNYSNDGTDRNISVAGGWNLIGYSSNVSVNLSEGVYTNSSGSRYTWQQAINARKVQAYLIYRENNRYKYVGLQGSGMHDYALRPGKAYWVYVNQSGNLTLPGVGGSPPQSQGQTFAFSSLMFHNGTKLANMAQVTTTDDWVFLSGSEVIKFRNATSKVYNNVCTPLGAGCQKTVVSPWEGYFIWSDFNNITMIIYP